MRDIDEQIAIKLFDWHHVKVKSPSRIPGEVAFEMELLRPPNWNGVDVVDVPAYSLDLRVTNLLMDRLIEGGWYFVISHKLAYPTEWICQANNGKEKTVMATSSSLPGAICKAILGVLE